MHNVGLTEKREESKVKVSSEAALRRKVAKTFLRIFCKMLPLI